MKAGYDHARKSNYKVIQLCKMHLIKIKTKEHWIPIKFCHLFIIGFRKSYILYSDLIFSLTGLHVKV